MKSKVLHVSLCVFVFIVAVYFRFAFLAEIPRGLNWDETAYSYNAYSLLKTGKDEWGIPYPLFLKSFGEYKPALFSYLILPLLTVFSNWDFAARFVPALLNSLAIPAIYLLVFKLSSSKRLAFLTAFTVAVTPWHIHFSRVVLDPSLAFPLLIFGMLAWVTEKKGLMVIGSVLLILSMYSYNAERVFVPFLLASHSWVYWRKHWKKNLKNYSLPLLIFLFGSATIIWATMFGQAGNRSRTASFLFSDSIKKEVENRQLKAQQTGLSEMNWLDNTWVSTFAVFIHKYSLYLRPDFLFFSKGGVNASPILGFPERGNFLEIFLPFFLLGLWVGIRQLKPVHQFFLWWLFLAPIAGGLTPDSPHAGRALFMIPAVNFFIALGVMHVLHLIKVIQEAHVKELAFYLVMILFSLGTLSYWRDYVLIYPEQSESFWQGYYPEMVRWVEHERPNYAKVLLTNRHDSQALLFYVWYNKMNPQLLHQKERAGRSPYTLSKYSNIEILESSRQPSICSFLTENTLVVLHPDEVNNLGLLTQPIKVFSYFNRYQKASPAFYIYDTKTIQEVDINKIRPPCGKQST